MAGSGLVKRGRPLMKPEHRRSEIVSLRLTARELGILQARALANGFSDRSEFLRSLILHGRFPS